MNKAILRLAIPNIISNISVPLLSTVDTALMGRMSELHIGAVGLGAMIFNFIYWNFGFLRMGTTGITAQAYGSKNDAAISVTLGRAFVVVLVVAAAILLFQYPIGELSFYLMNISEEQYKLVNTYYDIRVWGAPATLGLYAIMGWFFGMQNAIYPLILTVVINIINIALSFVLIVYWGMDVDGVAYGTIFAEYIGLLLGLYLFYKKYAYLWQHVQRKTILEWRALKQFLSINRDIFIRTFFLTLAFSFFYSQSSQEGEMILAVNVILLQFFNWMAYGVDGFAFASESLVGKYKGRKDPKNTEKAIRLSFIWGMALAVLYTILYGCFGEHLLYIFTNQQEVVSAALPFLFWMILFPLLSTPCFIWDGVFVGLTASKSLRDSMLLAFTVFIAAWYILKPLYGNHGLWAAMLIFMVARAIFQWIWYQRKGIQMA